MVASDSTLAGTNKKHVLVLLGTNGNIGRRILDTHTELLEKYDQIFCFDKQLNNQCELVANPSIYFEECDATCDNYLENVVAQIPYDHFELDALNLIAQDYPVTSTGLSVSFTNPFSIGVHEYVQSLSVTAGSSYHLIKQVIDLKLLSSSIWLIGSIYDRVLPSPSLYSNDNTLYKPIAYSSGKYAQIPLRKQAAVYLAKYGGRCNSLSFGGIELNQSRDFIDRYSAKSPSHSLLCINDVLNMVKWALLDSPKSLNGSDILIDGAYSLS